MTGRVVPGGDGATAAAVWRRGVASLRRLPAPRLARMLALAAAAGVAASLTVSSSPLFGIGLLAALFLLGLEAIEPLAQEIDRPGLTERLPVDRGWLFVHHLAAPAVLLAAIALVGVAAVALLEPTHVAAAAVLAVPIALAGATGPVVAAVRDAPAPIASRGTTARGAPRDTDRPFIPPEFAGASNAFNTVLPVAMTAVATAPVYAMRAAGEPGTAARSIVGVALFLALTLFWIRRRDAWSARIRSFIAEGQAAR